MTRNYFANCNGVILVCDQSKLTTLQDLSGWIQAVNENSYTCKPMFTLWCNATDQYRGVEVTDELIESFVKEYNVCSYTLLPDMNVAVIKSYRDLIEKIYLYVSNQADDEGRGSGIYTVCSSLPKDLTKKCVSLTQDNKDTRWCPCS